MRIDKEQSLKMYQTVIDANVITTAVEKHNSSSRCTVCEGIYSLSSQHQEKIMGLLTASKDNFAAALSQRPTDLNFLI